jgi:Xaa-Pro aminopeptidase
MSLMTTRLEKLRSKFDRLNIDAFLVTSIPHVRYVTNFSGSSAVAVVTKRSAYVITDGRYTTQIHKEARGWKIFITTDTLFNEMHRRKLLRPGARVGFDGNSLAFASYRTLQKKFQGVRFLPKADVLETIAVVKDEGEIKKIKHSVAITDRVFKEILDILRPGIREIDVAAEISYRQRKHGAEADAFETIVASGARGALPHGRASAKKIKRGELVTLDFGCIADGYHSDLTRTVAVGKPSAEARKVYQTVLDAQRRAIDAARSGIIAKDLDAVARSYITEKGYGRYFTHSLGHGLGLQIHESPKISSQNATRIERGFVVTIEPGIYIPRSLGVRIEDDVVIRDEGCDVLNHAPKELLIL